MELVVKRMDVNRDGMVDREDFMAFMGSEEVDSIQK